MKDIDDLVDEWHEGAGDDVELHEFLNLSYEEFARWVTDSSLPDDYWKRG